MALVQEMRERQQEQKEYMPLLFYYPSKWPCAEYLVCKNHSVHSIRALCATVSGETMAAAFSTFVTSCAIAVAMPSTQEAAEAVGSPKMLRANLPSAIISVRAYLRMYKVCTKHANNTSRGRKAAAATPVGLAGLAVRTTQHKSWLVWQA